MHEELFSALRFRRAQIRQRWTELLRADRATTPLGNPDALVHLLDYTLDEVDRALLRPSTRRRLSRRLAASPLKEASCCGRNPLIAYFAAGEQALQEGLVLVQAATPGLDAMERDASLHELNLVVRQIARREIEAFCGVCQHRMQAGAPCGSATELVAAGAHSH